MLIKSEKCEEVVLVCECVCVGGGESSKECIFVVAEYSWKKASKPLPTARDILSTAFADTTPIIFSIVGDVRGGKDVVRVPAALGDMRSGKCKNVLDVRFSLLKRNFLLPIRGVHVVAGGCPRRWPCS